MITERPYGTVVPGKKVGSFVALTATSQLYKNYEDPTMTAEYRARYFPVVLMIHRWDGRFGFPGGFAEEGENPADVAIRELSEEVGIVNSGSLQGVCTHEADRLVVHFHHLHLGELDVTELQKILMKAAQAEHAVVEGCPSWVHLADYGRGKGLDTILNSNMLSTAVREELEILIQRI
jgi:8-oxo-dGTP pyrophosphatase MutT (NUDIX family)